MSSLHSKTKKEDVMKRLHEIRSRHAELAQEKPIARPDAYVCCKADLEEAKEKVMDLVGPNAVYCKDDHCVYFHTKTLESRVRFAQHIPNPHGNLPIEVLRAVQEARKHNPRRMPKMVRL